MQSWDLRQPCESDESMIAVHNHLLARVGIAEDNRSRG
jgi:hypothetical protein